jgi:type I restriction-modification system DNA methylase subunit
LTILLQQISGFLRLKMNLAAHRLEGDIQKAITYYEDPHELLDKTDFVMANPPFNVKETSRPSISRPNWYST